MTHELVVRPRALAEIRRARDEYQQVGHGPGFLDAIDLVLEAIRTMPLRFPRIVGPIHRALLRRYPYAVFFRVRPTSEIVVVLAVLHQHVDPAKWPRP